MFLRRKGRKTNLKSSSNNANAENLWLETLVQEIQKINSGFLQKNNIEIFGKDLYSTCGYIEVSGINKKQFVSRIKLPKGYYIKTEDCGNCIYVSNKGNTIDGNYGEYDVKFV